MLGFERTLTSRIVFTIFALLVYRIGSFIPIAGIDSLALDSLVQKNQSGILGMFNMLSGGSLGRMSVFALAIMPNITASIVVQIASMIYKPLEDMKKDGELGRRKMAQVTHYMTVLFAVIQAYGVISGLDRVTTNFGPVIVIDSIYFKFVAIITLVVGTVFLMWLGEQITAYGIGNGSSLMIFVGIVSGIPSAIINMLTLSWNGVLSPFVNVLVCILVLLTVLIVVFFEKAQRRVQVQYPKKQVGNKVYSGGATYIPLKLNTAGVIPPIFASSLLLFPATIMNFLQPDSNSVMFMLISHLNHGRIVYIVCYVALIIFFSFFYTAVVFNSIDTATNLKKQGAYLVGIRPGKNTADYFDYILARITVVGACYLAVICVVPEIMVNKYSISFALGGTSFLIVVNVVLETLSQIQTYMFGGRYEILAKKMKSYGKK